MRQAAELGGAMVTGITVGGLAEILELVPQAWGPAGPVLAFMAWGALQLVRRLVIPMETLVEQGKEQGAQLSRIEGALSAKEPSA
jgi:hypothetical protein